MTTVTYTPRGAARELFSHREAEVILSGPAGTGKSTAALFRLHLVCLANPGIRALIARKTAVSLGSTTLVTFEKNVAAEAISAGIVRWYGGSTREAASYRYTNKSVIVVAGLDKPERVLSSEYDIIFVDEATELTETDWETLATRLRNGKLRWQQQIAACNPGPPSHWLKGRADRGIAKILYSRHQDNPYLYDETGQLTERGQDYMAKLDALSGVRRARLRDGVWAASDGLIYDDFDPAVHMHPRFDIPASWTRYWAIDFGYTNPFVWQDWAVDPDGRLYLDKEIYLTGRTVDLHAQQILQLVAPGGVWGEPRPTKIICDHDAEGRATLERELQLSTIPAHKTVTEGIQAVQKRLRPAGDGKPRIYFLQDAVRSRDLALTEAHKPSGTADEIAGYVWDPAGKTPKEVPLKENDHGMDAMRYVVAHLDMRGPARVRFFSTNY